MKLRIKAHLNPGTLKPNFIDQNGINLNARLAKIFERIRAGKLYGLDSNEHALTAIVELKKKTIAEYLMAPALPSELDRAFKVTKYFPTTREFEIELYKPIPIGPTTRIGIAYLFENSTESRVIDACFAYPVTVESKK